MSKKVLWVVCFILFSISSVFAGSTRGDLDVIHLFTREGRKWVGKHYHISGEVHHKAVLFENFSEEVSLSGEDLNFELQDLGKRWVAIAQDYNGTVYTIPKNKVKNKSGYSVLKPKRTFKNILRKRFASKLKEYFEKSITSIGEEDEEAIITPDNFEMTIIEQSIIGNGRYNCRVTDKAKVITGDINTLSCHYKLRFRADFDIVKSFF